MPADTATFVAARALSDRGILWVPPNCETHTDGRRRHRQIRQMPLAAFHPACSLPDNATRFRPVRLVSLSAPVTILVRREPCWRGPAGFAKQYRINRARGTCITKTEVWNCGVRWESKPPN